MPIVIRRASNLLLPFIGVVLFVLAVLIPTFALAIRSLAALGQPTETALMTARQWSLLWFTVKLAAAAAAATIVLSLPGAYVVGRARGSGPPVLLAIPLLLPPMVLVFGWQKVLGWSSISLDMPRRWWMCVLLWASWSWPIPALVLGAAWQKLARSAFESAVLETTPARAFLRVARITLGGQLAACAVILFALFCGEYTVPHACGLIVYATELLGWASTAKQPVEVVAPALPMVVLIATSVGLAAVILRRRSVPMSSETGAPSGTTGAKSLAVVSTILLVVTVAIPLSALLAKMFVHPRSGAAPGVAGPMALAWRTYHGALLESAVVAGVAGMLAALLGAGVVVWQRVARWMGVWTLLFGLLPGALIGEALLAAYRPVNVIYGGWPIVVIAYLARYAWVGVLASWLALAATGRDLVEQARSDGAGELTVTARIRLAAALPILVCGAAIVAALSLADVATASMVQVPSVQLISLILIDKYHRFEDGMLISLSLWLVAAALPAAILLAVARRARGWHG
ncbi:MAG TPA: hypothetical protein VGM03_14160, partial [Phycisphaerae bacterium]